MARRSTSRSSISKSRKTNRPSASWRPILATAGAKLRNLAMGLALISAVSFLPPPLVQTWPTHVQTAVQIAGDIRSLLVDMAQDVAVGTGKVFGQLGAAAGPIISNGVSELIARIPPDLSYLSPSPTVAVPEPTGTLPNVSGSFSTAKVRLYDQIYLDHQTTFYCGCDYDRDERTSLTGCGLQAYIGQTRANRVEAEHVFPASQFGLSRRCWREPEAFPQCRERDGDLLSGRSCCLRVDPTFTAAHNDLHNLVPAVGMINGQRSNHNWGMVSNGKHYGACEILIDSSIRRVQPPRAVRGDIARIMLYMRDTYGIGLSSQDEQLYAAWNNTDPPDAWELERDRRITRLQGKANPYVAQYRRF